MEFMNVVEEVVSYKKENLMAKEEKALVSA